MSGAIVMQIRQLYGGQSVNPRTAERFAYIVATVGVELRATIHHVGADPYGGAGLQIGCHAVESHDA